MAAAEEAEARYDHETAVSHYTSALELPDLTAEEQVQILDGRSNSYLHWGDAVALTNDIKALVEAARRTGDERVLAEAMTVGGLFWRDSGAGHPPPEFIAEAEALANSLADDRLLGYARLMQASYAWRIGDSNSAWDFQHKALALAEESGDDDLLFHNCRLLSSAHARFNHHEEAEAFAARARALAEESGDLFKQLDAYAYSGVAAMDLAAVRHYDEAAFRAAQATNYRSADLANNMAMTLWRLGLYGRALDYATEATAEAESLAAWGQLGNFLDGLGRIYLSKGMLNDARHAFQRGYELSKEDKEVLAYHAYGLAEVALVQGEPETAVHNYQLTLDASLALKPVTLAGLSAATLAMGDHDQALVHSTEAVETLGTTQINEFFAQEIWWRHYQVLLTREDRAAFDALDTAQRTTLEMIETLTDEGLRRNYLNKVAVNRDIILTWTAEAAERGIALDPLTAHEPLTGNLREQFRRVVDIGGRLSALRDPEQLADFFVEEFVEMSGAERVLLLVFDENGAAQIAASFEPQDALQLALPLLEAIQKNHRPLLREDVVDAEWQSGKVAELRGVEVAELHQRSLIALPLIVQGRLLGVVYGDMRQIFGRFDDGDLHLLSMLANQAAAALENAELVATLEDRVALRTAELAAAKEEAESAREAAETANEAKSAFMSNMSHELRTPLNAILGFTRIVRRKTKDQIPQKQTDNLGKVLSSSEHLLGLINTVLDIAKIEAGRMDVINSRFHIGPLIESMMTVAQPLLKPGVELQQNIGPDLPEMNSDQDKIKQILLNLLSNAAKFTHQGSITVSAKQTEEMLVIKVADTGIGMNEEALGRVFEEFQQADSTTTRKYGGTGLGMPISRHLAQLLGGDLTVESEEDEGTTFRLELPL